MALEVKYKIVSKKLKMTVIKKIKHKFAFLFRNQINLRNWV